MSRDSSSDGPREGQDPLGLDDTNDSAAAQRRAAQEGPAAEDRPGAEEPPAEEERPAEAESLVAEQQPAKGERPAAEEQPAAAAGPAAASRQAESDTPAGGQPPGPPAAPPPAGRRGGRLLGGLALLIALIAAAGAGYLYYELIYQRDVRPVTAEVEAVASRLTALDEGLERRLEALADRQQAELEEFRASQRAARAETEQAMRESLAEVARQAPPATSEWQRAEVQYLLRIANHRVLMERDVEGALRLLHAADTVLAQLDDFSLHEVRARLADEIAALQSVEGTDVQGLFLRLEAAKRDLDRLPLREPRYHLRQPRAPDPDAGVWAQIRQQVSGLWHFRRLDSEFKPLLAPEEGVYLEMNLRLMLERAQLAVLRRQQMVFEQSMDTAIKWIHDYLNVDEQPVRGLLDELQNLRTVDLQRQLPDISGSLNALQRVLRNPA